MSIKALREALEAGPTALPWRWELSLHSKRLHIVGGRPRFDLTVMDFERWGMGSATIRLRELEHDGMNIMHKLHERHDWIKPHAGREHHADWCADIAHADAAYIVAAANAAPALLARCDELAAQLADLLEAVDSMRGTFGCIRGDAPEDADTHTHDDWAEKFLAERADAARAALATQESDK